MATTDAPTGDQPVDGVRGKRKPAPPETTRIRLPAPNTFPQCTRDPPLTARDSVLGSRSRTVRSRRTDHHVRHGGLDEQAPTQRSSGIDAAPRPGRDIPSSTGPNSVFQPLVTPANGPPGAGIRPAKRVGQRRSAARGSGATVKDPGRVAARRPPPTSAPNSFSVEQRRGNPTRGPPSTTNCGLTRRVSPARPADRRPGRSTGSPARRQAGPRRTGVHRWTVLSSGVANGSDA
jgi:hypothetical protein